MKLMQAASRCMSWYASLYTVKNENFCGMKFSRI